MAGTPVYNSAGVRTGTHYGSGVHGTGGGASNPSQLAPSASGYNPAWTPEGGGALPPAAATISQLPAGWAGMTSEQRATALGGSLSISPVVPDRMVPEDSLLGIRGVFGADWSPAPAFTPELQSRGIFGAARITGTNEVYTLGPGGTKETAESFFQKFGTAEQEGIVGEITKEQAIALGITDTKQTPIAPGITSEALAKTGTTIDIPDGGGTTYIADTIAAGIKEYLKLQEETKTTEELVKEKELAEGKDLLKELMKESEDRGADILAEEAKRGIEAQQKAVDDANGDLRMKMAEIDSLTASYNLENQIVEGKPITLGRQQGQQAQNYKMFLAQKNLLTSEASLLQANALALQGKLDSAQKAADRAIDLKYMDIETRLNNQVALLNLIQGELTTIQQTRADALNHYYNQQATALADQKATEKATYNTLLSQMNQYPDAGISTTDTLEQANAKIAANSKIYAKQIRPPVGSGANDLNWQTSTAGGLLGLDKSTASKFDTDLEQEINAVESGAYGREGARERALEKLRTKYPGISNQQWDEIIYTGSDTLYPAFPDGYESKIGKTEGEKEAIKQAEKEKRNYSDQGVRDLISSGAKRKISRAAIKSEALKSSALTDADKERFSFILDEMWTEGQKKINKQWR